MTTIDRRRFLARAVRSGGTLALAGATFGGRAIEVLAAGLAPEGLQRVPLGATGIEVTPLALGTGTGGVGGSSDQTRLGASRFVALVHHALDAGLNFIETADSYGSHPLIRRALAGRARDGLVILSKVAPDAIDSGDSGAMEKTLDRFQVELGIDRVDIMLLHAVTDPGWTTTLAPLRDALDRLKRAGRIRAHGVSCHSREALAAAAADPWTDVLLARINARGGRRYIMDGERAEIDPILRAARAAGKGVVGMKVFGAGRLTRPDDRARSIDCVFNGGLVDAVTLGMTSPEQVDQNVRLLRRLVGPAGAPG